MDDVRDRHYVEIEPQEATFLRAAMSLAHAAAATHAGHSLSEADNDRLMWAFGSALGAVNGPAGLARLDEKLAVAENG